jgi:hypothetical protein
MLEPGFRRGRDRLRCVYLGSVVKLLLSLDSRLEEPKIDNGAKL